MAIYAVTYLIGDEIAAGASYDERRQRLISNLDLATTGLPTWDETTSFIFAHSALTLDRFAEVLCEGLSSEIDIVVTFDPRDLEGYYFGAIEDATGLGLFLPSLKKLP